MHGFGSGSNLYEEQTLHMMMPVSRRIQKLPQLRGGHLWRKHQCLEHILAETRATQ